MARYAISILITAAFFAAASVVHGQKKTFDLEQVRSNFKAASAEYFEVVRDQLAGLESEKRPGAYWLVHVKPRMTGHFTVKYTYKYNDPFYSEGENEIPVGVGEKVCGRRPSPQAGVARFCLGDTVILPIRAGNRYDYSFSIRYVDQKYDAANEYPLTPMAGSYEVKVGNPLEPYMKLIGVQRAEMPHRNAGASTVVYYATFKAVAAGRFNLALSAGYTGMPGAPLPPVIPGGGTPVIITGPGTPITSIAPGEKNINYSDEKRFSSHAGNSFPTNLLLLQPGDTFSLPFLTLEIRDLRPFSKEQPLSEKPVERGEPVPVIQKLPFWVDRGWSYNAFIADYLPARP
jgi:hypothetical protein